MQLLLRHWCIRIFDIYHLRSLVLLKIHRSTSSNGRCVAMSAQALLLLILVSHDVVVVIASDRQDECSLLLSASPNSISSRSSRLSSLTLSAANSIGSWLLCCTRLPPQDTIALLRKPRRETDEAAARDVMPRLVSEVDGWWLLDIWFAIILVGLAWWGVVYVVVVNAFDWFSVNIKARTVTMWKYGGDMFWCMCG